MRKINWDEKLSDDDIAWLRQAGFKTEEQLAAHQAQFDAEIPEPEIPEDTLTASALDPNARASTPLETGDGPQLVDPRQEDPPPDNDDDYESWSMTELSAEVTARNKLPDTSQVEVTGTGTNGARTKADLVKGLRLWDRENPEALAG